MPPPNKKLKAGQQNTLEARAAKSGTVYGQEGFAVKFSKTDMKSVPRLKVYAAAFGRKSAEGTKGFPRETKGEGNILFDDTVSTYQNKNGKKDWRPYRVLYKLLKPQTTEEMNIRVTYPAKPKGGAKKSKKMYLAMVNEIKKRAYNELETMFGVRIREDMRITKISLIAYGTRSQMLHMDMTVNPETDLAGGCVPPGTMIFNLQGGDCRLGLVVVGDDKDDDLFGKDQDFCHTGGVAYQVKKIGLGYFAWLDGNTPHYGVVHEDASVRLHVEFKKRTGLEEILVRKDNDEVQVVSMKKLMDMHKESTTKALYELEEKLEENLLGALE